MLSGMHKEVRDKTMAHTLNLAPDRQRYRMLLLIFSTYLVTLLTVFYYTLRSQSGQVFVDYLPVIECKAVGKVSLRKQILYICTQCNSSSRACDRSCVSAHNAGLSKHSAISKYT